MKGQPFTTVNNGAVGCSDDDDIAAVITYVRGNSIGVTRPHYGHQVKSVRAKVTTHPLPFSPDEMMNISPSDL